MKSTARSLTEGPLARQILIVSLPLALSNLLQVLFNMSDVAVVGRFAGSTALGAVGSTSIFVTLFTGFLIGLGNGINVLVARFYGARNAESVHKTVHSALLVSLLAGVLLLVKNDHYNEIYSKVVRYGVITLSKPTNRQMVAQNLRILCATRERIRQMQAKQATVEEKIKEIRLVNRAKWLLIEELKMTEQEAHRYIEKQAMDLRRTRLDIAQSILKAYEK